MVVTTETVIKIDDGHCHICPRCNCPCFARYDWNGFLVCGFCFGIGSDDKPTGRRGRLPEGWLEPRLCPR